MSSLASIYGVAPITIILHITSLAIYHRLRIKTTLFLFIESCMPLLIQTVYKLKYMYIYITGKSNLIM